MHTGRTLLLLALCGALLFPSAGAMIVGLPRVGADVGIPGAARPDPLASSVGPQPPDPDANVEGAPTRSVAGKDAGPLPVRHPYADLVQRVLLEDELSPTRLLSHYREYFHALGFSTGPTAQNQYEENTTLAFSHPLGDVDDDGYDDILLDQYCNDNDACRPPTTFSATNPTGWLRGPRTCGWPHQVQATSGRDGSALWTRLLDLTTHAVPSAANPFTAECAEDYLIGMVPSGNGTQDLLLYRITVTLNGFFALQLAHNVYLVNGATGAATWRYEVLGSYAFVPGFGPLGGYVMADNFLLNPILTTNVERGVVLLPPQTQPALFVQSVGFNQTLIGSPVAVPYATARHVLFRSYQPSEWAAALDLATGRVLWKQETFQPNERIPGSPAQVPPGHVGPKLPIGNRSVVPYVLQDPYNINEGVSALDPEQTPARTGKWHWGHKPCCYDLTGDGVPDLLFNVLESTTTPTTNTEGPYGIDERIVLFDGATGKRAWDHYVDRNIEVAVGFTTYALGDVDGDGTSDFMLKQQYFDWDYRADLSIRSGPTGAELWRLASPREHDTLVIGDADGDGGNDLALVEFTFDVTWYGDDYSRSNVTHTPIKILRGSTGDLLWRRDTFQTPSDLLYHHELFRLNGLLDANQDGVGDLLFDDPLFLPDLTALHRYTLVSGADGTELFSYVTAGAFSFPALVSDVNGDGTNDFVVLNGDLVDLWLTTYYGNNGTGLWSRRFLALKNSNYVSSFPQIRTLSLRTPDRNGDDFLVNLHFRTQHMGLLFGFLVTNFITTKPQLVRYDGLSGTAAWAMPGLHDLNLTVVVDGASPASQLFAGAALYERSHDAVPAAPLATPIQIATGVTTFVAAFGLAFAFLSRRRP